MQNQVNNHHTHGSANLQQPEQSSTRLQHLTQLLVNRGDMRSVQFLGAIILDIQSTHHLSHQEAINMIERQVFHELQGRIRGMAHMYGVV